MDLALEFGIPVSLLKRSLSERELRQWMRYAQQRMLPARRLELYLAQVAMVVAKSMGGARNLKLADFMFDPVAEAHDDDDEAVDDLEAAKAFFEFKPRRRDTRTAPDEVTP